MKTDRLFLTEHCFRNIPNLYGSFKICAFDITKIPKKTKQSYEKTEFNIEQNKITRTTSQLLPAHKKTFLKKSKKSNHKKTYQHFFVIIFEFLCTTDENYRAVDYKPIFSNKTSNV